MLRSGRVKNDRQSLDGFLQHYRENSHAVVEATRDWMVIAIGSTTFVIMSFSGRSRNTQQVP